MNRLGQEPSTKQGRLRPIILRASQVMALVLTMTFAAAGFQTAPKGVYIQVDNSVVYQETTEATVGAILAATDVEIEAGAIVSPNEQAAVKDGMYITISTPKVVTLEVGTTTTQVETTALTVQDFIAEQNIDTTTSQLANLSPQDYLQDNSTLIFNQTEVKQETIHESQPLGVQYESDDSLYVDEETVIQPGIERTMAKTYEVTYVNGEKTQQTLISESVVSEGQPEIIAQGTKEREVASAKALSQPATMEVEVSAYSIEGSIGYGECTAASGYEICNSEYYNHPVYGQIRIVAADTSLIPMGSIIELEGFGKAIVLDTGSYIKGYRIDLLVATDAEAYAWGRNNIGASIVE